MVNNMGKIATYNRPFLSRYAVLLSIGCTLPAAPAIAQEKTEDRLERLELILAQQQQRIEELEKQLDEKKRTDNAAAARSPLGNGGRNAAQNTVPDRPEMAKADPAQLETQLKAQPEKPKVKISGDFRLREEFNWATNDAPWRDRTVIRARLRAQYALTPDILLGAQIATGNPDDPNSTDVTLGGFDDDLDVSLDQAYMRYSIGNLDIWGGKFPQIFTRTDMVWDGDVTPQGLGAAWHMDNGGLQLDGKALYFAIDENILGDDSNMWGVQGHIGHHFADNFTLSLHGAYYDYSLPHIASADNGDIRTNILDNIGRLRSDFNLGDVILKLAHDAPDSDWPVSLQLEYVHNFAADDQSHGYMAAITGGRKSEAGHLFGELSWSNVDADAVLAAFAQDNIPLGSDYENFAATLGYRIHKNWLFYLNFYHYRPKTAVFQDDWRNRLRFNLEFVF